MKSESQLGLPCVGGHVRRIGVPGSNLLGELNKVEITQLLEEIKRSGKLNEIQIQLAAELPSRLMTSLAVESRQAEEKLSLIDQVKSLAQVAGVPVEFVDQVVPSGLDSRTPAEQVEWFEQSTPPLNLLSNEWVVAGEAARIDRVKIQALRTMRNAVDEGAMKSADRKFGVDKSGRKWRKEKVDSKLVYYLRATLRTTSNQVSS